MKILEFLMLSVFAILILLQGVSHAQDSQGQDHQAIDTAAIVKNIQFLTRGGLFIVISGERFGSSSMVQGVGVNSESVLETIPMNVVVAVNKLCEMNHLPQSSINGDILLYSCIQPPSWEAQMDIVQKNMQQMFGDK